MARERPYDPRHLDVRAFTAAGAELKGQTPQAELMRLQSSLLLLPGDSLPPPVDWSAQGEQRPVAAGSSEIWLHLQAHTGVVLQCQRCLQPMHEPVAVDRWFRFAASEDEAARLDEDSDDDVLVLSRRFDLATLLEDELILHLPIVPRHDRCPQPLPAGDAAELPEDEPEPNPFAVLAALRRTPGGG